MKKYSTNKFFLFRENPFRVLIHDGKGFVEPPKANLRDANFHVWWFTSRKVASLMAHAVRYSEPVHIGEASDYYRRTKKTNPKTPSITTSTTPPTPHTPNLEDFA